MKQTIYWVLFLVGGVLIGAISQPAWGVGDEESAWLPREEHMNAIDRGAECRTFRSLASQAIHDRDTNQRWMENQITILKMRRNELESCAKGHGVALKGDQASEATAAEVCPVAYRNWLSPGYRFRMFRQDLAVAEKTLGEANHLIETSCGKISQKSIASQVRVVSGSVQ